MRDWIAYVIAPLVAFFSTPVMVAGIESTVGQYAVALAWGLFLGFIAIIYVALGEDDDQ